jgi:hypothetical protein
MSPELNWCGQPIGAGESYGGKPEHISKTWGKKPAHTAAKRHQHYAVITEEDLAEVFGHGKLTRSEAAKRLELSPRFVSIATHPLYAQKDVTM